MLIKEIYTITFFICFTALIISYFTYGKIIEAFFCPSNDFTAAIIKEDGIDYIPLNLGKNFLIQLLNITGLGPLFGLISGILWGPTALLWITGTTIFIGGVHDYILGMISEKHDGACMPEIAGIYLGSAIKLGMYLLTTALFLITGSIFVHAFTHLLIPLLPHYQMQIVCFIIMCMYIFFITILPVDKSIGKIYPVIGIIFIIITVIVGAYTLFWQKYSQTIEFPEFTFTLSHMHIILQWPFLFAAITYGAISGFHSIKIPITSRCIQTKTDGRGVFYGAMITEGLITLTWAAIGMTFYKNSPELTETIHAILEHKTSICAFPFYQFGKKSGILLLTSSVICLTTSGDTIFRSTRLVYADWRKIDQKNIKFRSFFALLLLAITTILAKINNISLWRYLMWINQIIAITMLWTAAMYLFINKKNYWLSAIPATFMTATTLVYIFQTSHAFDFSLTTAYIISIFLAILCFIFFFITIKKRQIIIS